MPVAPETIRGHLAALPQRRSLDGALELFDTLGYQYADELPLPIRNWPTGVRRLVGRNADHPIYLAQHRDFRVVYTHLITDHLSRIVERPIVEHTLHRLHPYALFVFANRDLTRWDFVNVKYSAEDGARRRTIRRIHVGPDERLHTAAERLALLAVPGPETAALELQSLHDQAFDVEEVTRQFYRDYTYAFGELCDDIARRNPKREGEAEREAQVLLDRLLFLYFIQKKGWLDGQRDYLYHHFQAHYRAEPNGTDFYSDLLFPLFVALSNEGAVFPSLGDVPFLNGGLFEVDASAPLADQLTIGNGVFRQVFDGLLEQYNFTVREDTPLDVEVAIDPEMLGQIFENLVLGLERGQKTAEDRRKATGSYYTPRVIVHFMCRQALKEYLAAESGLDSARLEALMDTGPAEQLTPEEVAELRDTITEPEARLLRSLAEGARVLDPAVGSGAFLVGMLYEVVALTKLLDVRLYGQKRVRRRNYDYDLKRRFIERNLYGVDIQPEAVRICELRLWLSLMVDYERRASGNGNEPVPALPNLSYRIRVGDSLIERLFGEPVQLDQLADDVVARQLIDRIQTEKRGYFKEPDLWEKQRRELRILELVCELTAKLVGAKRGAVLQKMSAEVPGLFDAFGEGLLTKKQLKAKREAEAKLARYDEMMEQAKAVYEQVRAMQTGELPAEARDVDGLRTQLGLSFIWRLDFAEVFADKGGFDVVIGNPPYVRVQTISAGAKALYKEFYRSATGSYDLYVVFAERAWSLLAPNGQFCFIQPNKFMQASYGKGLRKLLADHKAVKAIVDFGAAQVFGSSTNYTCLLFLDKGGNQCFRYVEAHDLDTWQDSGKAVEGEISADKMTEKEWNFVVGPDAPLFERLSEIPLKLGDVADVFVGLQTSADRVFIMDLVEEGPQTLKLKSRALNTEWTFEKGLLFPLVSGTDASRYCALPERQYILFPYRVEGTSVDLIDFDVISKSYPKTAAYWLENKRLLEARERGKAKGKKWYGYIYLKNMKRQSIEKICVPRLVEALYAAYDVDGSHFLDNVDVCGITLKPVCQQQGLAYLLGLLNSRLLRWYFPFVSVPFRGGWLSANRQFLSQLPIRAIDFDDPADVACHDKIVALVERMLALHKELQSAARADLERQIAETDAEIDALVYELYGLTEEETAVVEGV